MAYRLPGHLSRSRHGVLYLRLAVPLDLRLAVGQSEIYCSLGTHSVRQAADVAQALKIELWAVFAKLRASPMSEDGEHPKTLDMAEMRARLRMLKQQLRLQDRRDELEAALVDQVEGRATERKQHARELELVILAKGGAEPQLKPGMAFSSAMEEFLASQQKATTSRTYKGRLEHAREFFGADRDIRYIEQGDLSDYATHAYKDISNPTTAGLHVSTVCGMFNQFRLTKGWGPKLTTERLLKQKTTPDADDRAAFSLEQLAVLFRNAGQYKGCAPHKFWATLAVPFLGCRIEELAQINLHADLIRSKALGVWFLDLNARPDADGVVRKSLKNKASWRCVPIHSALVRHGFVDYLIEQRARGFSRPFESGWKPLSLDGRSVKWSHYASNWGGRELRKLIADGEIEGAEMKLSYFHSSRHAFSGCLGRAGVSTEIAEALLGHMYAGLERERYRKLKADPELLSRDGIEPGLAALAALLGDS